MMSKSVVDFFENLLNLGVKKGDYIQRVRLIRQVNGLNIFYTFIAWGLILPLYFFVPNSTVLIVIQFIMGWFYFSNLILNAKGHRQAVSRLTIYTFEAHLFLAMIVTNAWSSPALFVVALYPLLAVLVEVSIYRHLVIAILQIFILMGVHYLFPGIESKIAIYASLTGEGIKGLHIISLLLIPVMAAVIISIIFQENLRAREKQREMLNQIGVANRQLERYANELKDETQRLKAEVDIARQIQMMVIPSDEELRKIDDLDIAAIMRPADEVGGDYYDVIKQDGTVFIGMGDVTGHGLASGVIMMMAQTAIRTITEIEKRDMADFLVTLNKVLYSNIQRTKKDRSMTLLLMTYRDKCFTVSGQHETVLIRRNTGVIDQIDTTMNGFFIGMIPDIEGQIVTAVFKLEPGEVVLLYSDGVTEAENENGTQFGLERLGASLLKYGELDSDRILKGVVKDVYNFMGQTKIYDDISLMIIKQK